MEKMDAVLEDPANKGRFRDKPDFIHAINRVDTAVRDCAKYGYKAVNLNNIVMDPRAVVNYTSHISHVQTAKIAWTCPVGHTFTNSLLRVMIASTKGKPTSEVCAHCHRNETKATTVQWRDERVTMTLIADERQERIDMDYYKSKSTRTKVFTTTGYNIVSLGQPDLAYRPYIKLKDKCVHVAQDGEYAFVWTDPYDVDKFRNPLTRDFVNAHYDGYYFGEEKDKPGFRGGAGVEFAIGELLENGAKLLNVWKNPQYESPGVYSYGDMIEQNAALAEFFNTLDEEWLDWQHANLLRKKEMKDTLFATSEGDNSR